MVFRHIVKFTLDEKSYHMFINEKNKKLAFLRELEEDHLVYPTLEELIELTVAWSHNEDITLIKNDISKRYNFIPKIKHGGTILLLTTALLCGCANVSSSIPYSKSKNKKTPTQETTKVETSSNRKIDFEKLLAAADDELDFKYASDFEYYDLIGLVKFKDSSAVQKVFEYDDITIDDIKEVCESNPYISEKYKKIITEFAEEWLDKYPNTNFSIFYTNLKNLKVHEVDEGEMSVKTLSMDSKACYILSENAIYVLNDINLEKENDGYIIFIHELLHSARKFDFKDEENNLHFTARFYEDYFLGNFTEEALVTDFAYEMQGLNSRAYFYPLQSSYLKIILDAIDYDGADFINHSVNYLIDKMNEYTQTDEAAYILALMEAQATIRFSGYMDAAYTEFSDLYTYIVKLYMSKHLQPDMTYEDALKEFDNFYDDITYYYENVYTAYGITEEVFKKGFEESLEKFGITNDNSYSETTQNEQEERSERER